MKCRWKQHVFGHAALEFWKTTLNMREILKGLLWIAHLQILKDVRDRISWNCDTVWHPGGSWDIVKSHCTTSFGQRRRDEQSLGSGWWRGSLWRLRVLFRHRLWHRLHKRAKKCKEWFCSILNGGLALIASYCFNLGISWAFLSFESPACSEAAAHLIFDPVLEAPVPPSLATERNEAGRNLQMRVSHSWAASNNGMYMHVL